MTAKRLLYINGNFQSSPLLSVLRRIDRLFAEHSVPYAIIGGLAVVRSGAVRTTADIDILTSKEGWQTISDTAPLDIQPTGPDSAVDASTGVQIDVLLAGDDWKMVIPLAKPDNVREYDDDLGAWFISLLHLLELKTAVYLKKLDEDGIEIAAKDLADIVALLEANAYRIDDAFIQKIRIEVREEFTRILERVRKRRT